MIEWATWLMFKAFGKVYVDDRIIFWNGEVIKRIRRGTSHKIYEEEIEEILKRNPEILIIADGWNRNLHADYNIIDSLERKGIKVIVNTQEIICPPQQKPQKSAPAESEKRTERRTRQPKSKKYKASAQTTPPLYASPFFSYH